MSYLVTKSETISDSEIIIAPRWSLCEGHISVGCCTGQGFVYGTLIYPRTNPKIICKHQSNYTLNVSKVAKVVKKCHAFYATRIFIFRRVRKISKSDYQLHVCPVCLSVRPSVWKKLGSHLTDFYEISYLSIFRKSLEKFSFHKI